RRRRVEEWQSRGGWASWGSEFQKPCLLPPGFLNVTLRGEGVLREQFGGKFQKPCLLPPGFLNVSLGGAGAVWGQNWRKSQYHSLVSSEIVTAWRRCSECVLG